jgi:hypothetical protein
MKSESFHRLTKSLIDSGESSSIEEAEATFTQYGIRIRLPKSFFLEPSSQVIALTAINAAARSFLGNVVVESNDGPLTVCGYEGKTLYEFMDWAGVNGKVDPVSSSWPTIAVGNEDSNEGDITAWANGWQFGIGCQARHSEPFVPACIAAGGLAVAEAFSVLRRDNPHAGRRKVIMSLWRPDSDAPSPSDLRVPAQEALWLVGAGHLGQAYVWGLGFMAPGAFPIFLQDVDKVTESTLSTSMVSTRQDIGRHKTRVVGDWLEVRGYNTSIVERRFDEQQRVGADEPSVALFGVDNPATRRVLEGCGFRLVVDAGLGSGYSDFRAIRVRTFPGPSTAATLWSDSYGEANKPLAPAYERLLRDGADPCGVTTLATRAVGAPFVGCVAAGYVLAERIRRQVGGIPLGFVDLNLRNPGLIDVG